MRIIRAFAPAGIGNFAAGFDVLGAAVAPLDGSLWGDVVEISEAGSPSFVCRGPYADRLPADPAENLVLRTLGFFEEAVGVPLPPLAIELHKGLPVKSGLGSSAASVVATATALNAWTAGALGPLDEAALLEVVGRAESLASGALHLDNVAPLLLGGLLLVPPESLPRRLPFPADLTVVVASPDLELATLESRRALPKDVSLGLAVLHAQNLAAFVHALHAGDRPLLRETLRDLLAEPWRAPLVPGFREAQKGALAARALGASLSGAGPAVFAVAEQDDAPQVAAALESGFQTAGVQAKARICRIDEQGARLL